MNRYRKLETMPAVQYLGEPIPDVTCEGSEAQRKVNGCDNTRAHMPHVHSRAMGGLNVLRSGDWIMPVAGGPFCVVPDGEFRQYFEVPIAVLPAPAVVTGRNEMGPVSIEHDSGDVE